ncbi:MYND-type domain-containing protein [Mycena venus]|uniref:MYND-type domain-containing protein n=1 Tax=Mycena venus TaxID=2733690 RepID=A0A8H6XKK5_9AGAR|nr:MYND-type domain-containing protein [Mycena venus]
MPYETLPTAQQAIDEEYLRVAKVAPKAYVCSNCSSIAPTNMVLKLCATCKLTRYCSKECQKIHWKQHKFSCRLGAGDVERNVPEEYRAQKFAEHLTHIPWLMILIDIYAVVAMGLDVDISNATRSCLCARITVKPVPASSPGRAPSKPMVMLQFERFEVRPVSVLTGTMRDALAKQRALSGTDTPPPVLLYFSSDGDNFLFTPHPLTAPLIRHAAMRPVFDDGDPITEEKVVAELNGFIRLDTKNLCKLRGPLVKS